MAFAMAAAVGALGLSPMALMLYGPTPLPGVSSTDRRELGDVRDVRYLVVRERERGDETVLAHQLLLQTEADAHHGAAVDLPLVADGVDDGAGVVDGGELRQPYLAGLLVDLNLGDLRAVAGDGSVVAAGGDGASDDGRAHAGR